MSKKLLTIFGATGNQGGSVISTLLGHSSLASKYAIRAVTRDPSKPAAQALKSKGCEVVAADMQDASSLQKAIAGSYGVFALTNYWEYMKRDVELAQGRAIADACLAAGVRHLVWSSLPHVAKLTDGRLPGVDHFDAKAEVEEYIEAHKQRSESGLWASHYMPAFFMSNFANFINPGPDGAPTLAMPFAGDIQWPLIDIQAETGQYVLGAFEAGAAADGARIQAVSDWITPQGIVDTFTKYGGGAEVKLVQIPRDVFKGFLAPKMGDFAAEELTQNMELIGDYSYYGKGTEKNQAENDKWLLPGSKKTSLKEFVEKGKPWKFGGQ